MSRGYDSRAPGEVLTADARVIREIARSALGDRTPVTVERVGDGIYLLAGYHEVSPLPPDSEQQIAFLSLIIGIRFLARGIQRLSAHKLAAHTRSHAQASIIKDIELLQREA